MEWFIQVLRDHPELALFLTLAVGYAVGKIKIGSFSIGSVTGVLLVGVLIGQFGIIIDPTVKAVFFLLFLFALGYNVGPQFFKGLKKDGIPQVIFSVIVCVTGLVSVVIAGKLLGYNAGQAAGLTAGALTQSAVIGVGQGAIESLKVTADVKSAMSDFVPVGYAVTYIFGTIGSAFFLSLIGPKMLGVNLEEACKRSDTSSHKVIEGEGVYSGASIIEYRVFAIDDQYVGKKAREVENLVSQQKARTFIVRIKRGETVIEADADTMIEKGDQVAFSFRQNQVEALSLEKLGKEVADTLLVDFPVEKLDIYVTADMVNQHTIQDIREHVLTRGVFISKLKEQGSERDYDETTKVGKKDVLTLEGPKQAVDQLAGAIGKRVPQSAETNVVSLGLGILIGGLIGIPALTIGGVGLSLSTSGGALIMGLLFGYWNDKKPTMGRIPKSTIWFLSNVGLSMFIAVVGIDAGPQFISGFKQSGISFFIAGVVVTLIPLIVGVLLGKYVFKWSAPLILGACAGAMTTTAAIGAVCEKGKSNVPVLAYTVPYAVGNILLTIWGSIVVMLFA